LIHFYKRPMDNFKKTLNDASSYVSKAVQDSNIQDEASVVFSRAKQYTEEKLGNAERTEFDPQFVALELKTENTKKLDRKDKEQQHSCAGAQPCGPSRDTVF